MLPNLSDRRLFALRRRRRGFRSCLAYLRHRKLRLLWFRRGSPTGADFGYGLRGFYLRRLGRARARARAARFLFACV